MWWTIRQYNDKKTGRDRVVSVVVARTARHLSFLFCSVLVVCHQTRVISVARVRVITHSQWIESSHTVSCTCESLVLSARFDFICQIYISVIRFFFFYLLFCRFSFSFLARCLTILTYLQNAFCCCCCLYGVVLVVFFLIISLFVYSTWYISISYVYTMNTYIHIYCDGILKRFSSSNRW